MFILFSFSFFSIPVFIILFLLLALVLNYSTFSSLLRYKFNLSMIDPSFFMTEWLSTAHLGIFEGWGARHVLPSHATQVHGPAPVCILPPPATDVEYCSLSRIVGQSALLCSWWVIGHIFPSHWWHELNILLAYEFY